ncbi:MAG TPA: ATP-binding protein [Gemmataceae bacterium]|nr:ATP-binding protein [Gemmataceae bacterium]
MRSTYNKGSGAEKGRLPGTAEAAAMTGFPEAFFERLVQSAPDALIVIRDGRVVLANDRAEEMFGHRQEQLLGKGLEFLIPEWGRASPSGQLAGAAEGESLGLVGRRKDGSEFPASASLRRVEAGGDRFLLLALRDATACSRHEAALRARVHQQALVAELGHRALIGVALDQLMNEAVRLVSSQLAVESCYVLELLPDGRVLFQAGVGWGEGLVGQAATEAQSAIPAAQVLRTQAPVVVEDLGTDNRFPDAALLREHGVVSSLNVPLYGHERPFGVLGAHTTRRRRFTDEDVHFVQSVANVLSATIERKWLEQRQREQHLHRAEQMMAIGQVAAGVAHELRNPLTSIKGLVQVNLREARAHGLPDEDLAVIEHEIRRMERTLQTFLDFARPPKPARRRLDPAAVVERVFALVAGRARKQGVALLLAKPEAPAWLEADQDQLQQLLLNLVLNSLDAMPQGGRVEVELRPPRDGLTELRVCDNGPGIPAHILPKVFETFVSSKETGVGLGVPVSKRIAEDHGGSLSAYNLPEGGACFVLRLPAEK